MSIYKTSKSVVDPDQVQNMVGMEIKQSTILATLTLFNNYFFDVNKLVKPEMFTLPCYSEYAQVLWERCSEGKPCSAVNEIKLMCDDAKVPADIFLDLTKTYINAVDLLDYCRDMRHLYENIRLKELHRKSFSELEAGKPSGAVHVDYMNGHSRLKASLFGEEIDQRDEHTNDAWQAYLEAEARKGQPEISSTLKTFNKKIWGYNRTHLLVIGARKGTGKTTFALNECLNAAKNGHTAVFISAEMEPFEIYFKLFSMHKGIDLDVSKRGLLTADQKEEFKRYLAYIKTLKFFVKKTEYYDEVQSYLRQINYLHDLELVFVDYIQKLYLSVRGKGKTNRNYELEDISRGFKSLAGKKDCNCAVVALSQLTSIKMKYIPRDVDIESYLEPTMDDFRDSGSMAQDADAAILIWRYGDRLQHSKGKIEKNRHTGDGSVYYFNLYYSTTTQTYSDERPIEEDLASLPDADTWEPEPPEDHNAAMAEARSQMNDDEDIPF